jgi:hypothetical protein
MALRIHEISPKQGWPGTIVEIRGEGFDPHRDANAVIVGNRPALVLRAESDRLLVMAAEDVRTGEVRVTVGPNSEEGSTFELLPYPEAHDWISPAPPRFFHGPWGGTPSRNVQNQRVLVLPVFTTETPPVPAPPAAALIALDVKYGQVADFWRTGTFGATTWQFERHPDWLQLPGNGDFYIIDQTHINHARFAYLTADRRIVGDNGVIFAATGTGFIPILHPSPQSWSFLLGPNGPNDGVVLAQLKVGNTLYVGTNGGTFAIFNVASPGAAVLVGSVDAGNPVWDIALINTNAVIAQGPGGLGLVDVSNPGNPSMLIGGWGSGVSPNWATRVKTVGNRIYSNRGETLRVQDLTPMVTFANVAQVSAGDWIVDIAVDAGRCIVATDGSGIVTFKVTAGGVLEKARLTAFGFPREIRLAGNTAWIASSEDGLAAIDIGNLAAPAVLGSKRFKKDANSLILNGNEAVVAVGDVVLVSVDITNPAAMTLNSPEQNASFNVPMADRRALLIGRINGRGDAVDFDRIFIDALRAWFSATGNNHTHLNPFEGIVVSFHGPDVRAHSAPVDKLASWEFRIPFNGTKGLFFENHTDAWTTPTHEIVHWLGMADLYQERFADGSVVVGTAAPWCISGSSGNAPLFCAQRLTDALDCLKIGNGPAENVRQLVWTPTTQIDQTFDVVAHGATQNIDPNRVHALRLVVSKAMTYWVEVRQLAPAGLLFDQSIPVVPAGAPGCVLVTRATDEQSVVDNTFERPVQLMGVLQPGGTVVDASRNLVITVDSQIQANPLTYRVRIQWNQPIPDNLGGAFDLTITPWDLNTYETPDIWIDSIRNAANVYEFSEPGDPSKPILSGDRPWVKHPNTIKARIRNTGPLQVDDIHVTCYVNSPPGIGDNGEWQTLDTKPVATIPGHNEVIVEFNWVPEVDRHTCISVAALPKLGEVTGKNNRAQENVAVFDSASGSSHEPVMLEAVVRSPFTIGKKVDVLVRHLPDRWHAVVDHAYVWLGGKGSAPVRVVIWTDLQSSGLEGERGERLAKPTVEGWTFDGHYYRTIGGILAPIRAVPSVRIEFLVEADGGAIYVWGHLEPRARQVPIAVEIRAESGRTWMLYDTTDNDGKFSPSSPEAGFSLDPGRYTVQVLTSGSSSAAQTESEIRQIDLDL